jgi:CubicO group peptidase (beta-lactamase class C family)
VTDDSPFYIASTTKSLTATAAVLAAARGDLDLDAPMVRYLPDARLPEGIGREQIRVRDLLALTHGLAGIGPVVLRTAYTGEFTREQLLDLLRYHEPTGEYGAFEYNNLGYNLVGLILESIYGESWKEVVDRLVLQPLGMTGTSAYRSRLDPDRLALPHDFGPHGFAAMPLAKQDANLHAAGGHFASARDLASYLAAHQSGGKLDGQQRLPPGPLASTHEEHVAQDRQFGPFHRFGWGYGWDLGTYGADTLIHRFGGFSGYRSHVSFMPRHGIGVVVLVNGSGPASPAADLLATYIYDRLRGAPDLEARYAARMDTLLESAAEARREIATHREERAARLAPLLHPLEAFSGRYESPILGTMEWRVVADGLEVRIGVLESRAEVYDAAANQLRIELAGSGQVAAFRFPEGGGPASAVSVAGIPFQRVQP